VGARRPLFDDPREADVRDVVGIAISFPRAEDSQAIRGSYTIGTVGWSPE